VITSKEKDFTQLADFVAYEPSYGTPASFIAAPIYDGSRLVGVLVLQMPVDQINKVMTGNQQWAQDGLGQSGETILVGSDTLMRSVSRFFLEDRNRFLAQPVAKAIAGGSGTPHAVDYRGVPVLSSYAPLQIRGLNWVILSQMDLAEAYAPIEESGE